MFEPTNADIGRRVRHNSWFGHMRYGTLVRFDARDRFATIQWDHNSEQGAVTYRNCAWDDQPAIPMSDIEATHESVAQRYPATLQALHDSERAEEPAVEDRDDDDDDSPGLVAVGEIIGGVLGGVESAMESGDAGSGDSFSGDGGSFGGGGASGDY